MTRPLRDLSFLGVLFALAAALLYYVVWDLRPYPIPAFVDDYLYVRSAWYIKQLQWLGPFDSFSLVKRPLFAVLLATTSTLHVPYIQFQIFFYLAGAAFFDYTLIRLGLRKWIAVPLLAVQAFMPTLYDFNGSRVLRETFTEGLEFFIFGLALRVLFVPSASDVSELTKNRRRVIELVLLFGLIAFHWGMREEASLLSMLLVPLFCLVILFRYKGRLLRRVVGAVAVCAVLASAVGLTYLAIAIVNRAIYGVFVVNDFSEGQFPKAVGVLKSVEEGARPELLVEPSETDEILELSPGFRQVGEVFRIVHANDPDMDYSHQMFIMRVSALRGTEIGTSAPRTQDYFKTLYQELAQLCGQGRLKCNPDAPLSVIPRLDEAQWRSVPRMFKELGWSVLTTQHSGFDFKSQSTHDVEPTAAEIEKHYIEVTRQQPFGLRDSSVVEYTLPGPLGDVLAQQQRRRSLGELFVGWSPSLYLAAAAGLPVVLAGAVKGRGKRWPLIAGLLGLHALARVAAFSYFGAIDGSLPTRLVTPIYPFALTAAMLVVCLAITYAAEAVWGLVAGRGIPRDSVRDASVSG